MRGCFLSLSALPFVFGGALLVESLSPPARCLRAVWRLLPFRFALGRGGCSVILILFVTYRIGGPEPLVLWICYFGLYIKLEQGV